jgi:DNA-binding MarR family transcriptional regulator
MRQMNREMIEQTAARLQSAAIRLSRQARNGDVDGPINAPKLSALAAIVAAGPVSLAELAAAEHVQAPTMSRVVEALVQEGLVTRESVPTDRRSVRIAATPAGLALLTETRRTTLRPLADRMQLLGEHERRALHRGIEVLERIMAA